MKIQRTYEFDFLDGFMSYLQQSLAALHSNIPAKMEFLRTDSDQIGPLPNGGWADVMLSFEVSHGEPTSVIYRAAVVELAKSDEEGRVAGRLTFYKGVSAAEDPLFHEEMLSKAVFYSQFHPSKEGKPQDPTQGAHGAGQVWATMIYEFIRTGQPPQDVAFVQTMLDQC